MNTSPILLVNIADHAWTLEAIHCACQMARRTGGSIALVKLVAVQHPSWLGTDLGYIQFSQDERAAMDEYIATLEDYGVEHTLTVIQYITFTDALAAAADVLNASTVFGALPRTMIPFWQAYQRWALRHRFERSQREWVEYPRYSDNTELEPTPATHELAMRSL